MHSSHMYVYVRVHVCGALTTLSPVVSLQQMSEPASSSLLTHLSCLQQAQRTLQHQHFNAHHHKFYDQSMESAQGALRWWLNGSPIPAWNELKMLLHFNQGAPVSFRVKIYVRRRLGHPGWIVATFSACSSWNWSTSGSGHLRSIHFLQRLSKHDKVQKGRHIQYIYIQL